MTLAPLLSELQRLGVLLTVDGDKLHVDSPKGVLTQGLRETLVAKKSEILLQLGRGVPSDHDLARFENRGPCVELRVVWFPETIWLVPAVAVERVCSQRGIHRGRVWTPKEVKLLRQINKLTRQSAQLIASLKATFEAELDSVDVLNAQTKALQLEDPTANACPACKGTDFWKSLHGSLICENCHPAPSPSLISQRVNLAQRINRLTNRGASDAGQNPQD